MAATALALACLPLPAFVHAPPLARAFLGIAFFMVFVRALDLARGARVHGFGRRLVHLVVIVDTRTSTTWPRSPVGTQALVAAGWVAVTAAAWFAIRAPAAGEQPRVVLWLAAAAGIVGMFEGTQAIVGLAMTAGFRAGVPQLSRQPYRSRTLAEFWGQRWNPVISGVLREHCFRPLSRRPLAAMILAFAASGVLHAYLGLVSLGVTMAVTLGLFFLAQPPLLLAERRLNVRRWHPAAGRAWTIGTLILLWPLIAEPLVRLLRP